MLVYALAIAIGLLSLAFSLTAFFLPKIHRKDDFLWGGIGLFYALFLWVCAARITGAVLLGQIAAVTLIIWFGWEAIQLRKIIIESESEIQLPKSFYLTAKLNEFFSRFSSTTKPTPIEQGVEPETPTNVEPEAPPQKEEKVAVEASAVTTEVTEIPPTSEAEVEELEEITETPLAEVTEEITQEEEIETIPSTEEITQEEEIETIP
ncbi:MAG: hypothetical protein D6756_01300, partial [Cyanobacteria bacterium J083]